MGLNHLMSLQIPYIEQKHKDKDYISRTFSNQDLGTVYQIDFKKYVSGNETYFGATIYLIWSNTIASNNLQEKIRMEKDVAYLVHDEPNYWILIKNTRVCKTDGFNNRRIEYLFEENQKLKKDIEDLNWKMNIILKNHSFDSSDEEFETNEEYFSKLWDFEEESAQQEVEERSKEYELQEFPYNQDIKLKRCDENTMNLRDN